jgi:hypothetical protein
MRVIDIERLGVCIGFNDADEFAAMLVNGERVLQAIEEGALGEPPYVWNCSYNRDRLEDDIAHQYLRVLKLELRRTIAEAANDPVSE